MYQDIPKRQITVSPRLHRAVALLVLLTTFVSQASGAHPRECSTSLTTLKRVRHCPQNKKEWELRANLKACHLHRQNCSSADRFQYHCLMDETGLKLVEVCAPVHFIIGRLCAEFNNGGKVIQSRRNASCKACPFKYASNDSCKYQQCYTYVKSFVSEQTTTGSNLYESARKHNAISTTESHLPVRTQDTPESSIMAIMIPLIVAVLVAVAVLCIAVFVFRYKNRKRGPLHQGNSDEKLLSDNLSKQNQYTSGESSGSMTSSDASVVETSSCLTEEDGRTSSGLSVDSGFANDETHKTNLTQKDVFMSVNELITNQQTIEYSVVA